MLLRWVADDSWPSENSLTMVDSVPKMSHHIMDTAGTVASVARLRRSAAKQVLEAAVVVVVVVVVAALLSVIVICCAGPVSLPGNYQSSSRCLQDCQKVNHYEDHGVHSDFHQCL